MCNKMGFDTKELARDYIKNVKVLARFRSKSQYGNENDLKKLKPYDCPNCSRWHLTSKGKLKGSQLKTRNKYLEKKIKCLK